MSDRWTDRLSEYLDHDLSDPERLELEAHVAACAECAATLAGLREVVGRARRLEHAAPAEDLWPAIAARIGAVEAGATVGVPKGAGGAARARDVRAGDRRRLHGWLQGRFTLSLPQAAFAAAALMVIAGASVWMALGRGPIPATRGPAISSGNLGGGATAVPSAGTAGTTSAHPTASTAVVTSDPRYDATIAELQRVLEQDRDRLDPRTVRVLEKNLAIIDTALADARRAVEADPSNMYLRNHLASVMKRKVSLLRTATLIAAANQG